MPPHGGQKASARESAGSRERRKTPENAHKRATKKDRRHGDEDRIIATRKPRFPPLPLPIGKGRNRLLSTILSFAQNDAQTKRDAYPWRPTKKGRRKSPPSSGSLRKLPMASKKSARSIQLERERKREPTQRHADAERRADAEACRRKERGTGRRE